MLGDSSSAPLGTSSGDAPAAAAEGGGGGGDEFGDRNFGGNRWPRQETIALLKIRSDMDVVFRDASVKGPLWEEVSRKLGELGYQRSAKKCKEKFENVYKYHKRTKEGRTGKADGKTYRFFDQLAALEKQPSAAAAATATTTTAATFSPPPPPPPPLPPQPAAVMASPISVSHHPQINNNNNNNNNGGTNTNDNNNNATATSNTVTVPSGNVVFHPQQQQQPREMSGELISNSTSSSSSTDVEEEGVRAGRRKRKWKDFFERLMKEVIGRQEELQRSFLEAVERREQDRAAREESWRAQELARINRERELLAQERSAAAAKDAAVMAFLQKVSAHPSAANIINAMPAPPPPRAAKPPPPPQPQPQPQPQPAAAAAANPPPPPPPPPAADSNMMVVVEEEGEEAGRSVVMMGASSSRWPKTEVHDLIKLRTSLETKYQENGPKGPLWEEISAGMRRMGYNRSSKRCKEKWENINKYFKKVKESNKLRPQDSKTCPYFSMLDAIYRDRMLRSGDINSVPLMVQPEQQWPPPPPPPPPPPHSQAPPPGDEDEDDGDEDEDEDEEEAAGNNYEVVASKPNSVGTAEQ